MGEGGRSSCCEARLMSGVKKPLLEDRVFLLAETHPNSVCSWFAPRPTKPLRGEKAGSGKGETQMLSTALDEKQAFWFICCVGSSNKHWISLQTLSSCCGLWRDPEAHPWAVPALGCRDIRGSNSHSLWWDLQGAALQTPGRDHDVLPHLLSKIQSFEKLM